MASEKIKSALLVLILVLSVSGHYIVESPCPDVFEYKNDGRGVYGLIHVRAMGPVSTLQLRANFTIATRLSNNNYVGKIEPVGNSAHSLQDYNRGAPLVYRVDFPVTSPLPRPTSITANENTLCYGPADHPGPNQYVTMTSLQHTLFLKGGSPIYNQYEPQYSRPQSKPDPDFNFFNDFNDGQTQIFTFGDDGNRGSWNSITHQVPEYQSPQPEYQRPQPEYQTPQPEYQRPQPEYQSPQRPRPQPPQTHPPEPQYYPEVVTQPPTPAPRPIIPTPPSRLPAAPAPIECGVVSGGNERMPLVYHGQGYARGDWPWLVAIYKRKDGSLTFICSGTLISDRHVVTAAHCMQQKNTYSSMRDIVVKVGVFNLEDWGDDITVTRTLAYAAIHESYNASSLANDILVLTFERSVEFNTNIRPACLWNGNPDLSRIVGASGVVAGWGASETGGPGRGEPRVVRIPVVSTAVCRASRPDFHKLTSSNTLCAGDRKGSGPCLGDSGGGLYLLEGGRWRLRGVVSLSLRPDSGDFSCNLNEYVVFTDSAKYLNWIQSVMY